jgi:lysine 2,3-aminomutase
VPVSVLRQYANERQTQHSEAALPPRLERPGLRAGESMTSMDRANLRTPAQLCAAGLITEGDLEQIREVSEKFAIAITPHVHSLIDKTHLADPIAAQFVPTSAEMNWSNEERADPIGDEAYSPTPGIVHRYPDRVLLKPLHACPVYCRFCFRREMIGPGGEALSEEDLEKSLAYIESKEEIWEVVITGGDPLIMSPRRIKKIMQRLEKIKHVGVVRYHTRVPVVKPEAINQILIDALKISKAVYVVLHTNHVQELSVEAKDACAKLIDSGFPMLSQTVLLNGVNADPKSLEQLFRALVEIRIKPYYLHHGDLAKGTKHFRTSIAAGQQVMRALRGNVSGICQPLYVLDIPGGNGKVPIGPGYLTEVDDGNYIVRDYQGNSHGYQDSILPYKKNR